MTEQTFYVVQPFRLLKKRWVPTEARTVPTRSAAVRCLELSRSRNEPFMAFARTGDPDTGDWQDAEMIGAFNVPPEFIGETAEG